MNLFRQLKNNLLIRAIFTFLILSLAVDQSAMAYWVWSPESGKFVNPEGAVDDTAEQQFDYAMSFYEAHNYEKAVKELKNLVKKHPAARVASEAQYKMGTIYEEQNEFYKAFRAYQKIIDNYPNSTRTNEVIERQFKIGNVFLSGKKSKFMGVPMLPALPKAVEVFDQVAKNAPFGEYGDKALLQLSVAYRRSGNLQKAMETLQNLVENYPESALLPDAKYQLGEVSYQMSKNINRSQEGLETAEEYFESFLAEYPNSNVRKKAKRLKRAIDEKNAEKNFKIAQYYERENFLESAVIYYEDVARNYPDTAWAEKAKEKLMVFRAPVKFMKGKEDALASEQAQLALRKSEMEQALKNAAGDETKVKQLEDNLKVLSKKEKAFKSRMRTFGKQKVTDIRRRRDALKRKESELKEKIKTLEKKKKVMKNNTSEDLQNAFAKWSESLRAEGAALRHEKDDLGKIEGELGIPSARFHLPFTGRDNVENLRKMNADEFAELVKEKKTWDLRKEELYDFRKNVLAQLDALQGEDIEVLSRKKEFQELLEQHGGELRQKTLDLNQERADLEALKSGFETKSREFQARTGKSGWSDFLKTPGKAAKRSWDWITFSSQEPAARLEEAKQKKAGIQGEIEKKKALIQSIQKSFEDELQGKKTVEEAAQPAAENVSDQALPEDVRLKKQIKLVEREIRWRYEEIQDRNLSKREKMDKLEALVKTFRSKDSAVARAGEAVTVPARGAYSFFRALLFGLKPREEVIRSESLQAKTNAQAAPDYKRIKKLREQIEFESVLIESRAREIDKLKKDFRALKNQAEKREGFSYRTVFIEKPGSFLEDIVTSARRVLPQKERREILIERLDEETTELKKLQEQDLFLDGKLKEFETQVSLPAVQAPASAPAVSEEEARKKAEEETAALEKEVAAVKQETESRQQSYDENRKQIQKQLRNFFRSHLSKQMEERFGLTDKSLRQKRGLYIEERKRTEEELLKIVKKELKLVNKQQALLVEKKEKLQSKMTDFKKKEDYRYEVLQNDLEELFDQTQKIRAEKQNLAEEQKKLSEYLKSEVGSLEK